MSCLSDLGPQLEEAEVPEDGVLQWQWQVEQELVGPPVRGGLRVARHRDYRVGDDPPCVLFMCGL